MSTPTPAALVTVTRFDDASLQAAVDGALNTLGPDSKGAFVAHADSQGAVVSVAERIGAHWTIKAGAIYPWGGRLMAKAEIVASW